MPNPTPYLYQQIVEAIRRQIAGGEFSPGARLPSVRAMTKEWGCTPGTVQRAYAELARQGLVVSRPGHGTHVVGGAGASNQMSDMPLRRAALVQRATSFLLETLTAGYTPDEIEAALRMALDQWRVIQLPVAQNLPAGVVRFAGSHDLALTWLAAHFSQIMPHCSLQLGFMGSLRGLMTLADGTADLAGCHLYDQETETYNLPFVRRILPGQAVTLVTLAHRRQGLIVAPGNPLAVRGLFDLARPEVHFINRQPGSGTRVWLNCALQRLSIPTDQITGYDVEVITHTDVARAIAEGRADVGLGLESAAKAFGLDFIFLQLEPYDLVIPETSLHLAPVRQLVEWLSSEPARRAISELGGYEVGQTGVVHTI